MTFVLADRVQETTTSTGTGTFQLGGASSGYVGFVAGIGSTNTTYYAAVDSVGAKWEVGIGTVTSGSPNTLSRDTVLANSAGNTAAINFANPPTVFCTAPAGKFPPGLTTNTADFGRSIQVNSAGTAYELAGPLYPFRNRIINGDMRISQRYGTSATGNGTIASGGTYSLDRWFQGAANVAGTAAFNTQQVADAPAGFTNSIKFTNTGTGSVAATDFCCVGQGVEGLNFSDFGYGASGALAMSASFWVKSSVTGTFGFLLTNAAGNRSYATSFTIASTNTWTKITIPNIPGDTTGTWATDTTAGLYAYIMLVAGSSRQTSTLNAWQASTQVIGPNTQTNSFFTSAGMTFQFTGVQIEAGPVCTPFERVEVGEMKRRCQRYYYDFDGLTLQTYFGAYAAGCPMTFTFGYPTLMRAAPSANFSHTTQINVASFNIFAVSTQQLVVYILAAASTNTNDYFTVALSAEF